jgi:hypothetical protein
MPPAPRQRASRNSPSITVVIPALNEEHNLPLILENLPPVDEVVVVDGRSSDDTVAVAREVRPDVVVVRQTRSGKGNALVCGFAASTGDIVVTLNADGSADPQELPRFVDALLSGAEAAHGSRFRPGGDHRDAGAAERFGHGVLCRIVNLFFGTRFTDLSCGYNAYWRELLPALELPGPDARGPKRGRLAWGEGPEIDTLTTLRMATQGLRVVEVATVGYPRIYGDERPRRLLPAALRALRTAWSEYVRRWRIGRRPAPLTRHADQPDRSTGRHFDQPDQSTGRHFDQPDRATGRQFDQPDRSTGRHAARPVPPTREGRRLDRRREAGRPDLTVIRGEGRDERGDGTAHLRAVPGENYRRF